MSQTSESKVAGMWRRCRRHEEMGDCIEHNEHRIFDDVLFGLDESTEAIAEARQEKEVAIWKELHDHLANAQEVFQKRIDRLTADLDIAKRRIIALEAIDKECESRISAVTKQRDRFIEIARDMQEQSNNWCEIQVGDLLDYLESIEGEKT